MIKRVRLYLTRKYKRSILLFLLLFVVSFSISVALSIWNSINAVTKEVEQSLGTSITMKISQSALSAEVHEDFFVDVVYKNGVSYKLYDGPPLSDAVIQQIMEDVDGFSSYNAELVGSACHLDDLELIPGFWQHIAEWEDGSDLLSILYTQSTTAYGNTDSSLYTEFRTGSFELVEGRHLVSGEDQGKVLISDELAALNQLELGDTIDVSVRAGSLGYENIMDCWGEPMTLEIIGIFHVNGYQPAGEWVVESENMYNIIFTDIDTIRYLGLVGIEEGQEYVPEQRYLNVTFFAEDAAQLPELLKQVQELPYIDTQYYDIAIDDTMYQSTVDPLNSIRNLVAWSVAAIVAGCAVVLFIVFTMWVRSRQREIAVYLSMGFGKAAILGQFVLEAALVALLAGAISFAACQKVPDLIGNRLLASAIETAQPEIADPTREDIHQAAQSGAITELFAYQSGEYAGPDHIDFTFRAADFLLLLLLELLIITAAICRAGWFIFDWGPRKIMTTLR